MASRRRWLLSGTGAVLLAVGTGACGSSDSGKSSTAASQGDASTKSQDSVGAAATLYGQYTGGGTGPADKAKTPVVIGFMNAQGGVPSFPEGTAAAEAAVKFINEKLGGIKGHPLKLKTCFVTTEGQGQECAQQFLAEKLPAVIESNGNVGGTSFHQTLASKIPVINGQPTSIADATAKNSFGVNSASFGTSAGFVTYATGTLHAKTASLIFPGDDPTGQLVAKKLSEPLEKAGIKVTRSGYNTSSADLLPTVVASGASKTDMSIALLVAPSACIAGAKAYKQANVTKPVIGLLVCVAPPVKKALGDYPNWTFVSTSTNVEAPEDPATKGYLQVLKTYAAPDVNVGGSAQPAFMSVMISAKALNGAGGAEAKAADITKQLEMRKGPTPMFAPEVKYGSVPGLSALPTLQTRVFSHHDGNKWTNEAGGKWISPQR